MEKQVFKILCVDDEPEILRALRRVLRPQYEVLTAESAGAALELLAEHDVALIVSDQRMPGVTGVEFLKQTIAVRPEAIRMLLTGYADAGTLVEAINSGHIYKYISKPWEPRELLMVIDRALEAFALARENKRLLSALAEQAGAEAALRRQWEATFNSMHDSVFLFGEDGCLTRANAAARVLAERLGVGCVGGVTRPEDLFTGHGVALTEGLRAALGGARPLIEVSLATPAGAVELELSFAPDYGPEGGQGVLLIARDVTLPNQLARQLVRSEKMAAVGQLVSGVGHELNNPLTAVLGYTQLAQAAPALAPEVAGYLNSVLSEALRARRIVQNLLTFARQHAPEKRVLDLNSLLEEVLELRTYHFRVGRIEVSRQFSTEPLLINGDADQLRQVFLHLIVNAEQAMLAGQDRGRLTIRTESVGHMGRVTVADDGPGIAPEHLGRIFDPFFTTRRAGEGAGLGLSISYGIVEGHGGRITAANRQPRGAALTLELALVPGAMAGTNGGGGRSDESRRLS